MVFAVFGGDERQTRLAAQLMADGHQVRAFAMDKAALPAGVRQADISNTAVGGADCIILPLPASSKPGCLNAAMASEPRCMGEVFAAMSPGQTVCAGMPDAHTWVLAERAGVVLHDYYARDELLAVNAVATAEGTIGIILEETESTLWGSSVLVIGWGRLGKALAPRLHALGARVSVSARNPGDMAWIRTFGLDALDTYALEGQLGGFDIVVNTVPSLVLTSRRLSELSPSALIIDLASKPGGIDFDAAKNLKLNAVHALSLPGKWAPDTAAAAIKEAVFNILGEL